MRWHKVEFKLGDYKYDSFGIKVNYTSKKEILKDLKRHLGESLVINYRIKNIKIKEMI